MERVKKGRGKEKKERKKVNEWVSEMGSRGKCTLFFTHCPN